MGSVTPLHNGDLTDERKPRASVIEACEELLEMAKSGEIVGLICAYTVHDKTSGRMATGAMYNSTIGDLERIKLQVLFSEL